MRRIGVVLSLLLCVVTAAAEPVTFTGSVRSRAEAWSFFDAPGYDGEYSFLGTLVRGSAAQKVNANFDWQVELAAPILIGLPEHAVAPAPLGQLGLGASYYAGSDLDSNALSIFPKQAFVRYRNGSHSLRLGRFEFGEGNEVTPKNAMLAQVKSSRVAQRLVGPFGFSHVGRSADGAQYVFNQGNVNVTLAGFRPTVGAFDVEGIDRIDGVSLGYGALTYSRPNADERLFLVTYRDSRGVLKTDNRPAAARGADRENIEVTTLGGHYLAAFGSWDVLLWGAIQTGQWGVLDHSAGAADVEAGYHFAGKAKPVLRFGLFRSTGDGNNADGDHETFFQVLPTPRVYARFPFYNAMNSTDAFAGFSAKPTPRLSLSSELHLLSLTEKSDLWYAGGGAFEQESFGFAGRPANGNDGLATTIDFAADFAVNAKTNVGAYVGLARGGDVVDAIFAGDSGRYVYLEVTRKF